MDVPCNISYPYDPEYEYDTFLTRINLDERRKESITKGRGFLITQIQSSIKKDLKSPNGIYSLKFGHGLQDINPLEDEYTCECGFLKGRRYQSHKCPKCGKMVQERNDDLSYFGWMVLDDVYTIHPNLFKALASYIGKGKFDNIIKPIIKKDENGFTIKDWERPKDEPFCGIGITEFKKRFDEIIEYYNKPSKKLKHDDIVRYKNSIFTRSIPVYSTILRPTLEKNQKFTFEETNKMYQMMSKLVFQLNNKKFKGRRRNKTKEELLYDLTMKFQELYAELENILAGKKGAIRAVYSGRCTFSSRSVIVPEPSLRMDQVIMPYQGMVELLQQTIVNILQKTYNIGYNKAYKIWEDAGRQFNQTVYDIMDSVIKSYPRGIPILLNRNPTIAYGGILQCFIVGICKSYTLKLPLQILPAMAADFDGDVLNVLYLINQDFIEAAFKIFNPRNTMLISRNDGKMNADFLHTKDTMINLNSLLQIPRKNYSQQQLEEIQKVQSMA